MGLCENKSEAQTERCLYLADAAAHVSRSCDPAKLRLLYRLRRGWEGALTVQTETVSWGIHSSKITSNVFFSPLLNLCVAFFFISPEIETHSSLWEGMRVKRESLATNYEGSYSDYSDACSDTPTPSPPFPPSHLPQAVKGLFCPLRVMSAWPIENSRRVLWDECPGWAQWPRFEYHADRCQIGASTKERGLLCSHSTMLLFY